MVVEDGAVNEVPGFNDNHREAAAVQSRISAIRNT